MTIQIDANHIKGLIYNIDNCADCVNGRHLNDHEDETKEVLLSLLHFLTQKTDVVLQEEIEKLKKKPIKLCAFNAG